MATEKRQRKKLGHQARMEAARQAARRDQRKRRLVRGAIVAVVITAVLFAVSIMGGDDDPETTASTTTTSTTTPPPSTSSTLPPTKPTVTVPDGPAPTELQTTDLVVGDGPEAKASDTITVHYVGVTYADGKEFAASYGGEPLTRQLSGLIAGWQEGIPGMKVGGRRQLVIPSALAYPDAQPGGDQPVGALVFVIDLLGVAPTE